MDVSIKIDQNRIDQCVELVNEGFVHIGTIFFHYDIYYDPEADYTYEIGFINNKREYRMYGYAGKYKFKREGFSKKEIFDPLCSHFFIRLGEGCCAANFENCIIKDEEDFGAGCSYRREQL